MVLAGGGKEGVLSPSRQYVWRPFFFVCHDVSEWGGWVGERWFVTGLQWVEAGNAGKHSTMHGTGLWFLFMFLFIGEGKCSICFLAIQVILGQLVFKKPKLTRGFQGRVFT